MSKRVFLALSGVALLALTTSAWAAGQNGTTLAAVKTLGICTVNESTWRYFGEVAVWNEGAVATSGLIVQDYIQNKVGAGQFQNTPYSVTFSPPANNTIIPAGTTQGTATVFKYTVDGAPLDGDIRNDAKITILNHSGSLGVPKGPEVKATWTGGTPPACGGASGCTYSQGYWGNKPGVVWPAGYSRNALFYPGAGGSLINQTWQQVMDAPANVNGGYYILAYQFIAATLNNTNGASLPTGVGTILDQANAWFTTNAPAACAAKGSCGTQKDWGAILETYNLGKYPEGPPHCTGE
jgi:hypothetical protein